MVAKMGSRLKSQVSVAEVIVVKGSDAADEVFCAGVVMSAESGDGSVPAVTEGEQVLLGKRYSDEESGIELLCTKTGVGPLSFQGRVLGQKQAKQLPASD